MTGTKDWSTIIPDLAERQEAARLYRAMVAAENEADERMPSELDATPEQAAALRAVRSEFAAKSIEIDAWNASQTRRILCQDDPEIAAMNAQAEAAHRAYSDHPGDAILTDDNGEPRVCGASGAPLYESDEVVEDNETDEIWLRAALMLPPRPDVVHEDEDAD